MILQFLFGCIGREKKQRLQNQQQKEILLKGLLLLFLSMNINFYDNSLTAIPSIIWQKHRKPFLS